LRHLSVRDRQPRTAFVDSGCGPTRLRRFDADVIFSMPPAL
jgi:hypothetical protein